jgi:hypothetical protein
MAGYGRAPDLGGAVDLNGALDLDAAAELSQGAELLDGSGGEEAQYLDACVAEVEAWLGAELTAYLAGAESPAELSRWLSDASASVPGGAGRRLQTVSEVVEIFAAAGQGTRARAWLREVSRATAGRSPADLVRHARTERLLDQVREAAERHLREAAPAAA